MNENVEIYKGNIVFTAIMDEFTTIENGFIVVNDGIIVEVSTNLSAKYSQINVVDFGDKLIIPGFVDIHLHASQFENIALGLDLELLPWLETYTFPEEAKFQDEDYARQIYKKFVHELWKNGTTRSVIFATVHAKSTQILFDLLVDSKLGAFVGKVNMDQHCHPQLKEHTVQSVLETTEFIANNAGKSRLVRPIITPRYAPVCSDSLMEQLGKLAKSTNTPLQSHLSESLGEIELVGELFKDAANYTDIYDKHGLLNCSQTVMAHCVYNNDDEVAKLSENGVFIAHCPISNIDVTSGFAPIKRYIKEGLKVGLGSDISGGHTMFMTKSIVYAIETSKMYSKYVNNKYGVVTTPEAFYMATKGGGELFGKVGSFEVGYEFDALVIDDSCTRGTIPRTLYERIQKFIYMGSNDAIIKRYVAGNEVLEVIL